MDDVYEQFFGAHPGSKVKLIDASASPYTVETEDGFSFSISADDFRTFYRKNGRPTPEKWMNFVTDPDNGMVNSNKMLTVMSLIRYYEKLLGDFDKSREFLRLAAEIHLKEPDITPAALKEKLAQNGLPMDSPASADLRKFTSAGKEMWALLANPQLAPGAFPQHMGIRSLNPGPASPSGSEKTKIKPKKNVVGFRGRMKNIEMSVETDTLTMKVDLSQEFGPSKSGKTIIVASTEGNIAIPGRSEKIGMNIYRSPGSKGSLGQQKSFKNVTMDTNGNELILTVDLSQEFGPSKSGKTTIIASTEGNQLVFEREEKIGLNVYK